MMRNHNHDYFTILKQLKKLKSKLREWYVVIHCLGGGGERGGFGSYQTKIYPIPPKAP